MTVPLEKIAKTLLSKANKVDDVSASSLRDVVKYGNTLIEVLGNLLKNDSRMNFDLLNPVIDEIFLDLHVSVTLAMGEQYKAACVMLRACVEISLYIIYFLDHPLEARIWANTPKDSKRMDMSFYQVVEEMYNEVYINAASGKKAESEDVNRQKESIKKCYRLLSERVHGKYRFLQTTSDDVKELLQAFSELALNSMTSLCWIAVSRSTDRNSLVEKIPALGDLI